MNTIGIIIYRFYDMEFLNKQIEARSKKKKSSLVRRQISCGIFQELDGLEESKSIKEDKSSS
ncbi:hypothetical protein [Croceitalea vernalis]|uniref:Uncharacterized protein n=1 Tax=Croceitalea vernalis TaxID=3075599 RepID=A0ABU3BHA3_9FLAO|nr:hypothetical protein [Croceitalea sp. P007]MDT0621519.1 hypothetical protein [Croceitalea sp. P007]